MNKGHALRDHAAGLAGLNPLDWRWPSDVFDQWTARGLDAGRGGATGRKPCSTASPSWRLAWPETARCRHQASRQHRPRTYASCWGPAPGATISSGAINQRRGARNVPPDGRLHQPASWGGRSYLGIDGDCARPFAATTARPPQVALRERPHKENCFMIYAARTPGVSYLQTSLLTASMAV